MPIYEYHCHKCGGVFEAWQKFGDPTPAKCELCGAPGRHLAKLISGAQVVFKGSGFYLTDNKSAKNSNLKTNASEDKPDGKSESKPENGASKKSGGENKPD